MRKFFIVVMTIFINTTFSLNACAKELNDALWMLTAAEYRANLYSIYQSATRALPFAIRHTKISALPAQEKSGYKKFTHLPPAIVMDLDETVISNYKMIAHTALTGGKIEQKTFNHWLDEEKATPLPGAIAFINYAKKKGVHVFFVTNRQCHTVGSECKALTHTIQNLRKIGIDFADIYNVFLSGERKGWSKNKETRFNFLAKNFRIIMMFGDNLGDFFPRDLVYQNATLTSRLDLVKKYKDHWGKLWFMLPNPNYGSWLSILKEPYKQYLPSK